MRTKTFWRLIFTCIFPLNPGLLKDLSAVAGITGRRGGLVLINNNKKKWRFGFSTGSCAAAAARAALLYLLSGSREEKVKIYIPGGKSLTIPVAGLSLKGNSAKAAVIKDAGGDPDITDGITITAEVKFIDNSGEIIIAGGSGVGKVTRPGLGLLIGEAAINPVPREMIKEAVKDLLPEGKGIIITISAPGGETIAEKTFNPRLGIKGGISILGTSGLVRPMSREAFLDSLLPQVTQAAALGYRSLVLTPGGKGERKAKEFGICPEQIIQTSNFIGDFLDACVKEGVKEALLLGHLGKLVKVAAGIFNTHSATADGRRETLAAYAALAGAPQGLIRRIMEINTLDASVDLLKSNGYAGVYFAVAEGVSRRCRERTGNKLEVAAVFYDLKGELVGWDKTAERMGVDNKWHIPLK